MPASVPTDRASTAARRSARLGVVVLALGSLVLGAGVFCWLRDRQHSPGETSAPQTAPSGAAQGRDLLLITLDTTRADHLGCYGSTLARTPNLDGLARGGVLFEDAVSAVPLTTPSHATILTGLDPPRHGVRNNGEPPLAPQRRTLAEILGDRGYATAAFVSAFVLDHRYGLGQGFEVYDDRIPETSGNVFGREGERPARETTAAALEWLERRPRDRPWFAWVHYYDAHDPYLPPEGFAERFRDHPYDGEIASVDAQVGRVLAALDRLELRSHTLIVIAGDHGESLGEHHEGTHSRLLYEGAVRVPLIMACPGVLAPQRWNRSVVTTADILPTVLHLLGVEGEVGLDGCALFDARSAPGGGRTVYLETLAPLLNNGWAPLYALRSATRKFVRAPRPELYDLERDPGELRNLYVSDTGPGQDLQAELERLLAARGESARRPDPAAAPDAQARAHLSALGYVEGASPDGSIGVLDPKDMMPVWQMILDARELTAQAQGRDGPAKLELARRKIEQALKLSPSDRAALEQSAKIFTLLRRIDLAEESLRKYLKIRPSADACVFLAQLVTEGQRYTEAEALLDQAETLEPAHGGIWIARGEIRLRQGRLDDAIADFEKALAVDPARAKGMASMRLEFARAHKRAEPARQ
jgi:choline-sulfatase